MEKILNQSHNKHTFIFACSRLFERAAFYGIRGIIVLYMVSEGLEMTDVDAITIYTLFASSLVISPVLGALLGDLLIGNKKAIIIGGILQALGAFTICINSTTGLYLGLSLVVLGGGLYAPNMISHFGKLYLNKTKLLDAAFTIFYLAVNIGSLLGVLLIGFISSKYGWNTGFIIAGILMLISVAFPLFSKETNQLKTDKNEVSNHLQTTRKKIITPLSIVILVSLFWVLFEISNIRIFDVQTSLTTQQFWNIPNHIWFSLNTIIIFPASLIVIFIWTYYYSNHYVKLTIGFILGAISCAILLFIPEVPNDQHIVLYFISLFILAVSEIHIAPLIHSVLTKYANPKYLAIFISLIFIPTKLFALILMPFNDTLYEKPTLALTIGMSVMLIIGGGLLIFLLTGKNLRLTKFISKD